jgi:hypothetical protein
MDAVNHSARRASVRAAERPHADQILESAGHDHVNAIARKNPKDLVDRRLEAVCQGVRARDRRCQVPRISEQADPHNQRVRSRLSGVAMRD